MGKKLFLLATTIATVLIGHVASVNAVITPAGTQIRNRSSATYQDMSGNSFAATSNEVITVVLPVYGVSILPDDSGETPPVTPAMSQNALAGQTVYVRYDITNTGNDNDSYSLFPLVDGLNTTMALIASDVAIYHDLNGNGILEVGEPVVSSGGVPGNIGPIASTATASIIVAYTVPPASAAGEVAYVGVDGTSAGDPLENDTRNYHLTTVVNDAVLTANLTAAPPVVFGGNQVTYTLSGINIGTNTANAVTVPSVALSGVLLYDVIPLHPVSGNPLPIFGVPTGFPGGGTVLYLNTGNSTAGSPETWNWSTTSAPGDIAVAYITSGGIVSGQSYDFSYQVTIPLGTPAGVIGNTAALAYVDNDVVTPDPTIVVSNVTNVTVAGIADVVIGPVSNAGAGTPPALNDDIQSVASVFAGTSVDFTNTVRNDGNAPDQINIILDGSSTIPGGWGVILLQSDGVTPLTDTGIDGIPDVGPLASGDSVDVIVRLVVPGSQGAGGPFDAVIRAQSTITPGETNLTTDRVTAVQPSGVNIGNYNGGPGTNDALVNQNTNPGTSVDFALDVINTSGGLDTYTLSSSVPVGWTVTYYNDANGNGVLDPAETTPIAAIGPIAGSAEMNVIARVAVPALTLPGVNPVSFTATSTNNGAVFDTIGDSVTVNVFASVSFSPDLAGTATPGATISYTHTVTNTGNVGDTFDFTYVSSQAWTYGFFDALNNPITFVILAPGASATVIARLSVPAGATLGTIENGTLTALGQASLATDDVNDVTVIVAGNLDLTKAVSPATDQPPGAELTYTTDYRNVGTDSVTTVVIFDAVPAFTQFKVGSVTNGTPPVSITGIAATYSNDGGASWTYVPVSGGGGAPATFDANVTNVRFVLAGTLPPGAASAVGVGFIVRIIAE